MQRSIEEIKSDLLFYVGKTNITQEDLKEYQILTNELIETVATLQREKCAEEVRLSIVRESNKLNSAVFISNNCWVQANKESILNSKL